MSKSSAALVVHCQIALGLTQKTLGSLLGVDRRTVQRWQDRGFAPTPDQVQTLARALRPVRPDLADQVVELGGHASMAAPQTPASADVIDAILRAAADAGGMSPDAIRAVVTAAFVKAEEAGVDVRAIALGLRSHGVP